MGGSTFQSASNGNLALTRRVGEEIVVGDEFIVIKVVEIHGDKVRLSFNAARGVDINRRELFNAKKQAAANNKPAGA